MTPKRIALVVPAFSMGGGIPTLGVFLHRILQESEEYQADVISISMSSNDGASVRLRQPSSWWSGLKVDSGTWSGTPYRHVGAFLTEFEFQRYRPRRILTDLLNGYDLVQIIGGTPAWGLVASRVRRPVVLQVASMTATERVSAIARAGGLSGVWKRQMMSLTTRLDQAGLRHADFIFVINHLMEDKVRAVVGPDRVAFALPGVDTSVFHPATGGQEGYILAVGRFSDPRKNVALLFRAYKELRDRNPLAPRLMIASPDAIPRDDWDLAISLGISEHVDRPRDVSNEELARLYRNASIFALTSDEEGLGIVILEAMASGVPVVSTRCGGPETIVREGETGFLTPPGDATTFADRLHQLVGSAELRASMGSAARRAAEEVFSLQAATQTFLSKYAELIRCSPRTDSLTAANESR